MAPAFLFALVNLVARAAEYLREVDEHHDEVEVELKRGHDRGAAADLVVGVLR